MNISMLLLVVCRVSWFLLVSLVFSVFFRWLLMVWLSVISVLLV